tara:strand:- start:6142 stop:6342 length:201 start_codon:yes stop_codon:yes gene_type:complete
MSMQETDRKGLTTSGSGIRSDKATFGMRGKRAKAWNKSPELKQPLNPLDEKRQSPADPKKQAPKKP